MRICPTCFGLYAADQLDCPKDHTRTESHVDILIGRQLGPYVVRSLVGEGGMGVVYSGEHPALGKRVALKVLRPELSLRDDIVDRFVQEARAVSTIGHANIVNIYDFGRTPFGSFYFVMEYLDGKTIRYLLEAGGPQPLERVRMVVNGVGAALAAAHVKGFVHRDVKPENIMLVNRAGQEGIKLLDFGIVKLLTPDRRRDTHTGIHAMGTPQYMCPEQLEDAPVDYRADIYALGAVAYEMLTGVVPYPGKSQAEVRQLQLTRMPAPPSVCRSESRLSRALDAAVLWALSLDPAARPRRVEDFLAAFQTGYERTLVEQSHAAGVGAQAPRRRLVLGVALVTGALVAGGGLSLSLRHLFRKPPSGGSGDKGTREGRAPSPGPDGRGARPISPRQAAAEARQALLAGIRSPQAPVRALTVEIIGLSGHATLLAEIRELLEDRDPEVVKAAAVALAALGDRESAPRLRKGMESAIGFHKLRLAGALARLGDQAARSHLRQETRSANPHIRNTALELLGELGDATARQGLRERLRQSSVFLSPGKRRRILGYLAQCGDEAAREELRRQLVGEDWQARVEAAAALGRSSDAARAALSQALEAPGPARLHAAVALAHFGDERGRDTLIESLRSADEAGRQSAALALGRLRPSAAALEALSKARADASAAVALAAATALAAP